MDEINIESEVSINTKITFKKRKKVFFSYIN